MAASDKEEVYGECFENGLKESPLDDSSRNSNQEEVCSICENTLKHPRVLSCLHVFCEECLSKLLVDEAGDNGGREGVLICRICQQETKLGRKGVSGLPCDYVTANMQEMVAILSQVVVCTSCKAKEKAVARCSDCANFLCPNCNTAHKFMRCFENHKVVSFDELKETKEAVPIHNPVFCELHSNEPMKFFCYTCLVPICNECVVIEHVAPEHQYERLVDAYERQRNELQNLVSESKAKVAFCEDATSTLQNTLGDLQAQHDNAQSLINETFQSYKALLEKRKDEILEELKALHSQRELRIMETVHSVEKALDQIDDACKFTTRLLEHGSAAEVLALRRVVGNQLLNLINNIPKPDININIEFITDMDKFKAALKASFGHFRKNDSPGVTPQQESPPPPLSLVAASGSSGGIVCPPSSVTSSPVSMPSSFEGELGYPTAPLQLPPLTTIQEYNLNQLASLAEKDIAAPSSNPSPTPSFSLADLFSGDISSTSNALNNLQALAKLGSVTLGDQDIVNGALNGGAPVPPQLLGRNSPLDMLNSGLPAMNGSAYNCSSPTAILPAPTAGLPTSGLPAPYSHPMPRSSGNRLSSMDVRLKFGCLGTGKSQFNAPHGFCLGSEEDIIVADTNNHRIQIFDKNGVYKFHFGAQGKEEGQLWYPRKVAVMKGSNKFVVCDRGNERSRMQIFNKNGHFIKKISIRYIDIVAGLAVSSHGHIVAVDSVSPTVFIINDNGDLVNWFDCSDHMREPSDLAISGMEYYVCDFKGHCVVVFDEAGNFIRRIGYENITNFPNGIDISDAGDILVGDSHGNRFHVVVFNRSGAVLCEFECPTIKVSRCCGLKITSEGYIVTLAKNNHHVLILNTLYIV